MRKITERFARTVKDPGFYRADDTLYLYVRDTGRKSWVQRIVVEGRRRNIGLGPYPVVTFNEAMAVALDNRRKLYRGENPIAEKKASKTPTFRDAAMKYRKGQPWSDQRAKMFNQVMEKHVFPALGSKRVDQANQKDVLDILVPIWIEKPHQAARVRQFIRAILAYCQAHEYVTSNVAGEAIEAALPRHTNNGNNYRSLPYGEMPGAVQIINDNVKTINSRLALLFTIYTGVRGQETRGALWSEIDEQARTWDIPAERMKSKKPHRVPLSDAAILILEQAKELRNRSDLIFPSSQNRFKPMTSASLGKNLKQVGLGDKTTTHGFRSSFKTWATEQTDTPREVVESALAHTFGNGVEQAYFRGDLFEKRRVLMQGWADYLDSR